MKADIEYKELVALAVMQRLSKMSDRDFDIMLTRAHGISLEEIGIKWGIGKERVRQMIISNKKVLKAYPALLRRSLEELEELSTHDVKL